MRKRITFANVLSLTALLFAIGGTSYAGTRLAANSVGTKQIKNGAVTAAKIKAGVLPSAWVAANSDGIDAAGPDTAILTVHVPAGKFLASAKIYATSSEPGMNVLCDLWKGSIGATQIDYTDAAATTESHYVDLPLQGAVTMAAAGDIILSCQTNATTPTDVRFYGAQLSALKVSALH